MRGTLEVGLKAHLHPRHQQCTDEAQKAETVLSAVIHISNCRQYCFDLLGLISAVLSQPSYSHVTQSLPSSIDKSSLSSGSSQRPHRHTSVDPCGQSFVSPPMRARISKLSLRRQPTPEEVSHSKRSKGSAHKPSSSCSK